MTTDANDLVAPIHDRMPVILHDSEYDEGLAPDNDNTDELQLMFKPYPGDQMEVFKIGKAIGNVKNNSPDLIDRI